MTYRNLAGTEIEETEPTGPTPEEVLAAKEAEIQELKAKEATERSADRARVEQLERMVRQGFAQRGQPHQANEVTVAKQELGITDQDLVKDPQKYIEQMAEHIASRKIQESEQRIGGVLSGLVESTFETQLGSLGSHRYYEDLAPVLREHFNENPSEKYNAGAVRQRFNELIGANLDELERRAKEREKDKIKDESNLAPDGGQLHAPSRTRAVEQSVSMPVSQPRGSTKKERKDDGLNWARNEIMESFNRQTGLNMDPAEWDDIESGRKLPRKVSAIVQTGKGRANVDYESN